MSGYRAEDPARPFWLRAHAVLAFVIASRSLRFICEGLHLYDAGYIISFIPSRRFLRPEVLYLCLDAVLSKDSLSFTPLVRVLLSLYFDKNSLAGKVSSSILHHIIYYLLLLLSTPL